MIKISLKDFAKALDYQYQGDNQVYFSQIVLDSRKIEKDSLFLAIKGDKSDGHDFIEQAIEKGAVGVISFNNGQRLLLTKTNYIFARETDSLEDFFKRTAEFIRAKITGQVIAITGSVGKTTTKDMLYAILNKDASVIKTEENYNNELGLPMTMTRADENTKWLILEMGMRGKGEIAHLAQMARPKYGIITSIEPVHAELLGSLENIAAAKAELAAFLPEDGCLIINYKDREILAPYLKDCFAKILTVGFAQEADYHIKNISSHEGLSASFILRSKNKEIKINLNLPGKHNVQNAAMASALVDFLGLNQELLQGLEDVQYSQMRFKIREKAGVKIINDAYNANPASTCFSLDSLQKMQAKRKIFIFADMFELGPYEISGHEQVAEKINQVKPDYLFLLGEKVLHTYDKLKKINYNMEEVFTFKEKEAMHAKIKDILQAGDLLLLKGSRGMQLEESEKEIEAFLNDWL